MLLALSSLAHAQAIHDVDVLDFAYDPDPIVIVEGDTVAWTWVGAVPHSVTAAPGQTESFDSGVLPTGSTFSYTFATPGTTDYLCTLHPMTSSVATVPWSGVSINEVLADPDAVIGDANCDGVISTTQDEFVEIVNGTGAPIDLSYGTLSDAVQVRHTFPAGTILLPGDAVVVFGGGTPLFDGTSPSPEPWCRALPPSVHVQVASTGSTGFNNTGDTLVLADAAGDLLDTFGYGAEGGNNNSLVHEPELTRGLVVEHATTPGAAPWSPGTDADGIPWGPPPGAALIGPATGVAGAVNQWDVVGGPPSSLVVFLRAPAAGVSPVPPCPGQTVELSSVTKLAQGFTDANGDYTLNQFIPPLVSGMTVHVQAVFPSTCDKTNPTATSF